MTKREAMTQIPAADLKLVAQAAASHVGNSKGAEYQRIRRAAKLLARIQTGKKEG